uniref:K Homology domain-containing protein n=1 Tax=Ascaris lumbricoides TaxID=6252 RepID=A0A0M3HPU4_ASCLU
MERETESLYRREQHSRLNSAFFSRVPQMRLSRSSPLTTDQCTPLSAVNHSTVLPSPITGVIGRSGAIRRRIVT